MKYETKEIGKKIQIILDGELLNSSDLDMLETCLGKKKSVFLDMTRVTYINSSGFGALVDETLNFKSAGLSLTMGRMNRQIRKIIGVLGAEELLEFED